MSLAAISRKINLSCQFVDYSLKKIILLSRNFFLTDFQVWCWKWGSKGPQVWYVNEFMTLSTANDTTHWFYLFSPLHNTAMYSGFANAITAGYLLQYFFLEKIWWFINHHIYIGLPKGVYFCAKGNKVKISAYSYKILQTIKWFSWWSVTFMKLPYCDTLRKDTMKSSSKANYSLFLPVSLSRVPTNK